MGRKDGNCNQMSSHQQTHENQDGDHEYDRERSDGFPVKQNKR